MISYTFIVADFEGIYHDILGSPVITKFMAVPHDGYLVLKLPKKQGILSLRGNVFMTRECVDLQLNNPFLNYISEKDIEYICL